MIVLFFSTKTKNFKGYTAMQSPVLLRSLHFIITISYWSVAIKLKLVTKKISYMKLPFYNGLRNIIELMEKAKDI
jgi:hypothetical protein